MLADRILFRFCRVITRASVPLPSMESAVAAFFLTQSIANRVVSLAKRVGVKDAVVFAGGCARNRCLRSIFEKKLQQPILVAENPDILSAYGAALMARR